MASITLKRYNGSTWDTFEPITKGQNVYGSGTQATTPLLDSNNKINSAFLPSFTDTNYYPIRSYTSGLQISSYSGSSNCQLYVPYATNSQAGVVTTSGQTFAGDKYFSGIGINNDNGAILITSNVGSSSNSLDFYDNDTEAELGLAFPEDGERDEIALVGRDIYHIFYRHSIYIYSASWGTTNGTAGSTTRTIQFEIINNIANSYLSLSTITAELSKRGASSSARTILARYAQYAGGVFSAKNGTVYNLGFIYRASTTSSTTTTNYLNTTSPVTIEDRVTSFNNWSTT